MSAPELRRILIIDDEPDILTVTEAVLRSLGGFETQICGNPREAVAIAERFAPDLVLLDVMMPTIDGPTTLKALRENPETEHTPVIFMTAKVMPDEAHHYGGLGVAGVIAKPYEPQTLVDQIRALWGRSVADDDADANFGALREVIAAYGDRIPDRVAEIEAAFSAVRPGIVRAPDAEKLARLAHRLGGTAETFGHPELGAAAAALERAVEEVVTVGEALQDEGRRRLEACVSALRAAAPPVA